MVFLQAQQTNQSILTVLLSRLSAISLDGISVSLVCVRCVRGGWSVTPTGTAAHKYFMSFQEAFSTHVPIGENLRVWLTALKIRRTFPWHGPQTFWVKFSGKTPLTDISLFCSQWDSFTPMSQPSSCKTNSTIHVSQLLQKIQPAVSSSTLYWSGYNRL